MSIDVAQRTGLNPIAGGASAEIAREPVASSRASPSVRSDIDLDALTNVDGEGVASITLLIENLHCAGCIAKVERSLKSLPGVVDSRVNLSTRRIQVRWLKDRAEPELFLDRLAQIGYPARPFDATNVDRAGAGEERELLRCVAVAGFAAANIMLLSISVWSGSASDMPGTTRDLFHWVSALIALPTVAYAGRPFFRSAMTALSARSLNMDVPISLAVLLATAMSLVETARSGEHAYFDAAVTLLFFLLVGRYLDRLTRSRVRNAAERLLSLNADRVTVLCDDGTLNEVPIAAIVPGMLVQSLAGERIAVDGTVEAGDADIDTSLLTGESVPVPAGRNALVHAGTLNLNGSIAIRVTAVGADTLLSGIVRLVETAEQGHARYVRLADRVSRIYAPVVHVLGLATFLGWWVFAGSDLWPAMMAALAVLIITCPCALGLAVPAVQVAAVGRLLRSGVLVKSADALEKLSTVDLVVFDKTGTLTEGHPYFAEVPPVDSVMVVRAAALARRSRHPMARAFAAAVDTGLTSVVTDVEEVPGAGLKGTVDGVPFRIGNRLFCEVAEPAVASSDDASEIWIRSGGDAPLRLTFHDRPREDAAAAIRALRDLGIEVRLVSGDRPGAVEYVARACGIKEWRAACMPACKVSLLEASRAEGRRILMVGDGINDAPAIAAATVGMSPGSAATVTQVATDLVFLGGRLGSVVEALCVAREARRLVRQNFILAIGYNVLAVPIAMAGLVTPLIAAVAMSCSSILVTLNATRVNFRRRAR